MPCAYSLLPQGRQAAPQTKCSSPQKKQRDFTSDFRNYGVQKAQRSSNEALLKRSAPQTKCSSNEAQKQGKANRRISNKKYRMMKCGIAALSLF